MGNVYLISLIVGGFFVVLSIFGGGESDTDVDVDADVDLDFDADVDADMDFDADADADADADWDSGESDISAGVGLIDLLSIRALFLFAAFFGLTGILLSWTGTPEPMAALLSIATGLLCGLGGNYLIKKFAYAQVSSNVTTASLTGRTAQVTLPFAAREKGKIAVISKGQRLQLLARPLDDETKEAFQKGEDVVIIRMNGSIAEVVKPT